MFKCSLYLHQFELVKSHILSIMSKGNIYIKLKMDDIGNLKKL